MQKSVSKKHRKVGRKHRNGPGLAKLRKIHRKRMHAHRGKR
jgi:hypothetical protein